MVQMSEVTEILKELSGEGRENAMDRLVPLVYDELRSLARSHLRHERPDHSLQATALVHEVYLRLLKSVSPSWNDRQHFFRAAALAMRRILIDHARSRNRLKREGRRIRVEISGIDLAEDQNLDQVLALDEAFQRLEKQDPRAADVVRLRFYAGLSVGETAEALDISERTVKREWAFARAWLYETLREVGS